MVLLLAPRIYQLHSGQVGVLPPKEKRRQYDLGNWDGFNKKYGGHKMLLKNWTVKILFWKPLLGWLGVEKDYSMTMGSSGATYKMTKDLANIYQNNGFSCE